MPPERDLVGQPSPEQILGVSALTRQVKLLLEGNIGSVWTRGEVSNFRRQASGHLYFSLKDAGSQIPCVMFARDAARLRFDLRDGIQAVAFAELSVYEPAGRYQLIVRRVTDDGVGRLQAEFERLKRKLAAEGLFAPERKRALPALPRTVGFITSPSGAALQDFISILRRRDWSGRLIVFPVRVQGQGAERDLVDMLHWADRFPGLDLLVIGRGGGSIEDLWPFNEEMVARAVAATAMPVISAVGHEIDFTLCDFAADRRAETPSGAAELITSEHVKILERMETAAYWLGHYADARLEREQGRIDLLRQRLAGASPQARIERGLLRLDDLSNRLRSALRSYMTEARAQSADLASRLKGVDPERAIRQHNEHLKQIGYRLRSVSPASVLQRGFAMAKDEQGNVLSDREMAMPKRRMTLTFRDGDLTIRNDPGDNSVQGELGL